uniref:Uncharacterized protein n=1 Tax=Gouania willdenowi TaxID=441366 RepID=A0A8C5H8C8_GOUWI
EQTGAQARTMFVRIQSHDSVPPSKKLSQRSSGHLLIEYLCQITAQLNKN